MATNTNYKPKSKSEYQATDINTLFKGIEVIATANSTTNHDLKLTDDMLIDGAKFHAIGAALGDKVTFQVIDIDNVLGYGENTVLGEYVTDWYINPNITEQLDFRSEYPAKVQANLYLRIIYPSTGQTNVDIIVNYYLHKILW